MNIRSIILAATIAVVTASSPALAASHHSRAGFNAYGAAIGQVGESIDAERAQALRDCTGATSKMTDYTWGVQVGDLYRSCMARHGQPE